jgi:hypothetical protein
MSFHLLGHLLCCLGLCWLLTWIVVEYGSLTAGLIIIMLLAARARLAGISTVAMLAIWLLMIF